MMIINKIFLKLVSKNIEFKNKFLDQSCYIIGNGQSIKYLDLEKFSKKKHLLVAGCTYIKITIN